MPSAPALTINSARPRRPTTSRQPVIGLPASLLLHGLAIASIFLVFNSSFAPPEETHAVPVELVTLALQTNVAAAAPPPQEEPVKRDLPPLEPPPVPELRAEPAPDVKPPKIEIQKQKPPDTRQDISSLLNQLTRPERPAKNAQVESQSAGLASAMNASLADLLRSQIRLCWSPIAGAPNPADQIVSFDLRLNPDGTIASNETLTVSSNPYTVAAISAANRAIYQCAPYHLPASSYSQWRQFRPLRFDPRQMVQQ
jgi:outer membrane biosynthesis protein TonB